MAPSAVTLIVAQVHREEDDINLIGCKQLPACRDCGGPAANSPTPCQTTRPLEFTALVSQVPESAIIRSIGMVGAARRPLAGQANTTPCRGAVHLRMVTA